MNIKIKILIPQIAILGFLILLTIGCKKETDNNVNDISGKIQDTDGNLYDTVRIGSQTWMVQNLKVTHYLNKDPIPNITDNTQWENNSTTGAYCNYNNDPNNAAIYGRLYNYMALTDSRNICPKGWHIPTNKEWITLASYLGGDSIAGRKMKEIGTNHWLSPNDANNSSGFIALPGGCRDEYGIFQSLYYGAFFFSSTWDVWEGVNICYIFAYYPNMEMSHERRESGYSIRCIKN